MLVNALKLCAIFMLFLLGACGAKSPLLVEKKEGFVALPAGQAVLAVPFATVMVPPAVSEPLFNAFVDELNGRAEKLGRDALEFLILKEDLENIDPARLAARHYLTGELFGYIEDSGARATEIRLRSRLYLHQPGAT
jgi:hypothetical protein